MYDDIERRTERDNVFPRINLSPNEGSMLISDKYFTSDCETVRNVRQYLLFYYLLLSAPEVTSKRNQNCNQWDSTVIENPFGYTKNNDYCSVDDKE